ncbi:MAG TPA: tetratricopeptide repeat protein [Nitrospinaceae bacterium]|nr:tetratricopeptide repeat protein [Nitrospinaceae bacterium]
MKSKTSSFFCGAFFFSLVFLFAFTVVAKERDANPPHPLNPFLEAEHSYYSGDFDKAQLLYQNYLNGKPSEVRGNTALYRLGTIHQKIFSCATALRYYKMVLNREPALELTHDSKFRQAQCLFELEQYDEAEASLEEIALSHPDAKKKWEAKIYLGRLDEKRLDYKKAIEKLKVIYSQSEDKTIQDQTKELIRQIVTKNLDKITLIRFSKKYSSGFPLDQILLRLISIYRDERDLEELRKTITRFLQLFPEKSERLALESTLKQIEGNKENKMRLGVVLPLTGEMSLNGQQLLQGIQLAVNESNLKYQEEELETVVKDSASAPIKQLFEKLATDPSMIGVLGPFLSDSVRDSIPIAERYHLPMMTSSASFSGLAELSPYVFRNAVTRELEGKYIAEYAVNRLRLRRFVILHPSEEFGFDLAEVFVKEVESLGGEVVSVISYERSQTDFKKQIHEMGGIDDDGLRALVNDQAKNNIESKSLGQNGQMSRPLVEMGLWSGDEVKNLKVSLELSYDAIFIPGFYDKVGLIVPQLVFYNIDTATLLGARGWNSPELTKMTGKHMRKGYFVDGFYAQSKRPEVVKFVREYKKNFGEDPTILSAQAYDAAKMFFKTIHSGAKNRLQVKKGLLQIRRFQGVSGETSILPTGEAEKKLFAMKIVKKKIIEDN